MSRAAEQQNGNPFPGLRPFREDEEHLFFGRETQVDTMIDKLAKTRFLTVLGSSGSGKSSLVNCGLRPALHRGLMVRAGTSWAVAQFRPGSNPVRAMACALSKDGVLFRDYHPGGLSLEEIVEATLSMSKLGLADIYEQSKNGDRVNLLVVADQFEELFRYRKMGAVSADERQDRSQQAAAFVNLLLEAKAQAHCPIYVVLTMRSDFLGDCAQFPGLPEAINEGQYLVPRLAREERRAAIAGPVGVAGEDIDPVLLTRLVNDVGDNPDQLSILQHALNRTWAHWQHQGRGEGQLSLSHYEAIGTMAHALNQHAEKAFAELATSREKSVCEKMFKALTDVGTDARGVRRPTSLGVLCALASATQAEVTGIIDVFRKPSRSFLMPPVPELLEPDTVIDISHESLMRVWVRLKTWADEEAQSAQLYRRLSETASLHAAGKAGPWRDPDLQIALAWRDKENPTAHWAERYGGGLEVVMSFLAASEALREKETRDKAEHQRRELEYDKAKALAEEQALRLAIQTKAARRFRLLAIAMGVMSAMAIYAGVWAFVQESRALKASKAAIHERDVAEQQKSFAEAERQKFQASLQLLSNVPTQQVEAAVARAAPVLPRVYMQIVDETDRDYAKKMGTKLRESGFLVLGIELVAKAAPTLKVSEVRYYKKAEEHTAGEILKVIQTEDASAKLTYLGLENSTKVRPNHFEVWFSHRNDRS